MTIAERNSYIRMTHPPKAVEVRKSRVPNAGLGLFAKEYVKKGEFIARFSGEPLNRLQSEARDSRYRFKVHNDLFLDGENQYHLEGRYLNCPKSTGRRPNVRFGRIRQTYQCMYTGLTYSRMYASQNIPPDDEMIVSYGQAYWNARQSQSTTTDDTASDGDEAGDNHDDEDSSNDDSHNRSDGNNGDEVDDNHDDEDNSNDDSRDRSGTENNKYDKCDSDNEPDLCSVYASNCEESDSSSSSTDDESGDDYNSILGGSPVPRDDDSDHRRHEALECFLVAAQPTTPDELSEDWDTVGTSEPSSPPDVNTNVTAALQTLTNINPGGSTWDTNTNSAVSAASDANTKGCEPPGFSPNHSTRTSTNSAVIAALDANTNGCEPLGLSPNHSTRTKSDDTTPASPGATTDASATRSDDSDSTYQASDETDRSIATDVTDAATRYTLKEISQASNSQLVSQSPDRDGDSTSTPTDTSSDSEGTPNLESTDTSSTDNNGPTDGRGENDGGGEADNDCHKTTGNTNADDSQPTDGSPNLFRAYRAGDNGDYPADEAAGAVNVAHSDTNVPAAPVADEAARGVLNDDSAAGARTANDAGGEPDDVAAGDRDGGGGAASAANGEPDDVVASDGGGGGGAASDGDSGAAGDGGMAASAASGESGGVAASAVGARAANDASGEPDDVAAGDGDSGGGAASAASAASGEPDGMDDDGDAAASGAANTNNNESSADDAADGGEAKDAEDDCMTHLDEDEKTLLQDYIQLARLPAPPSRIPRQHVKEFIKAAERSASTFLRKKTGRALLDILRLPKTVFDPYITRRKTGIVRTALKDYPKVELPDPDAPDRKRRQRPSRPLTREAKKKAQVQRVEKLFQDGYTRKAMRELTSTLKPIQVTDEVLQRLRELHPIQDTSNMTKKPYSVPPSKPDAEDLFKTMSKMNMEASGGSSGWTPRHLKIAMRSPTFVKFMTTYAGMMAEGTAPGRILMRVSLGIGLKDTEKMDNKIRPIDRGEVIYKACVIACFRKNRQRGDLPWYMLGSGTPGGVEPLIYLKRLHLMGLSEWDSNGVVEIDRSNAYNTMSIARVQKSLHKHNPKNGPLFEWCYGETSYTLVKTADGRMELLPTNCLTQGDPPAAYWYQHGDRIDMETLNERLGDRGQAISFIDDVSILKSTTNMQEIDEPVMMTAVESMTGGKINTSKSKNISNADAQAEGYETLGGFIGPPEKRAEFVKTAADKILTKIKALDPLRKQTQLILLRQCIIPSLNHLTRNVNPAGCQRQYREIKNMIASKIARLAGTPVQLTSGDYRRGYRPLNNRVKDTDLISLPTRYGGLGMGDQVVQSTEAWEASQQQCKYLVEKWTKGTSSGPVPEPQKKRMNDYWQKASNQLMNKVYAPQCQRIACNAGKAASAWLTTVPHIPELLIPDAAVAAGLRSRLLKVQDRLNMTKRKVLHQRVLDEFKKADYQCTLVTASTKHTTTDDPAGISDSLVEPMALSIANLNLSLLNRTDVPSPPRNTPSLLAYYRKKIHQKATKVQRTRFRKHYPGLTHFPLTITTSGALLGKSEAWIKQLKQRASLNQVPSPVTQLISATTIQSMW